MVNLLLHHGVRACLEYQESGDAERARRASNPDLAPHVSFLDMGGHGYATLRLTADAVDASSCASQGRSAGLFVDGKKQPMVNLLLHCQAEVLPPQGDHPLPARLRYLPPEGSGLVEVTTRTVNGRFLLAPSAAEREASGKPALGVLAIRALKRHDHPAKLKRSRITGMDFLQRFGPDEIGNRTDEPIPAERQAIQVDPGLYDAYVGVRLRAGAGFSADADPRGGPAHWAADQPAES